MIGREAELADALAAVTGARTGRSALVVGPVGSGVSMLLAHASMAIGNSGGRALQLSADGFGDVLGTTLADVLEQLQRLDATAIVVDDLHLLDPATAALLQAVVRNSGVAFLGGTHPTSDPRVTGLAAGELVRTISLEPLPPPLVGALCAGLLDRPVHTATVSEISARTGGWPGLVSDLVHHAVANGSMRAASGLFRFVGSVPPAPATTRRVRAMVAGWPSTQRDQLATVALAGGLPGRLADLDATVAHSGLVLERGAQLVVAAPAVADAIEALTPSDHLATIAEWLLAHHHTAAPPRQVHWQLVAGRTPPIDAIADAARWARGHGDVRGAGDLLAVAADIPDATPAVALLRVEIAQETGDYALSADILARLSADEGLSPAIRAHAASELATTKLWYLDEADEAVAIATGLQGVARGTSFAPAMDGVLGTILTYAGRVGEALPLLEPLVHRRDVHASLLSAASTALALAGRCEEAVDTADHAMALRLATPEHPGLPGTEVYVNAQAMARAELGDLAGGIAAVDALTDGVATTSRHGWKALARLRLLAMQGRLAEAAVAADEAALVFADLDRHATLRWAVSGQALVAAYQGRAGEAADALARLDALGSTSIRFLETDIERARAFTLAADGDLAGARAVMRAAASAAVTAGSLSQAAAAWHDVARLGAPDEAAGELALLDGVVRSRWQPVRSLHAAALAARDAHGVLGAAEQFLGIGAGLHALEAASQAQALARASGARGVAQRATALVLACQHDGIAANTPAARDALTVQLTPREREVAELVVNGRTSREAAAALGISPRTVENLLQRVYLKLGIQDRTGLAELLLR